MDTIEYFGRSGREYWVEIPQALNAMLVETKVPIDIRCREKHAGYICTCAKNHSTPHIAVGLGLVCAIWPVKP